MRSSGKKRFSLSFSLSFSNMKTRNSYNFSIYFSCRAQYEKSGKRRKHSRRARHEEKRFIFPISRKNFARYIFGDDNLKLLLLWLFFLVNERVRKAEKQWKIRELSDHVKVSKLILIREINVEKFESYIV